MINREAIVEQFLSSIAEDGRIRSSHISVFFTLIHILATEETFPVVKLDNSQIEKFAKLEKKTYLKCLRQLSNYGYLVYQPTNDSRFHSSVIVRTTQK